MMLADVVNRVCLAPDSIEYRKALAIDSTTQEDKTIQLGLSEHQPKQK